MVDGTRIAKAVKPYDRAIAKGFDRELAMIARAAVPGFCDRVVLFTDRDYTPEAARDARRYYYAAQNPDPEADAALSHLCTDLHGRVQVRALSAQAGHLGGRMSGRFFTRSMPACCATCRAVRSRRHRSWGGWNDPSV